MSELQLKSRPSVSLKTPSTITVCEYLRSFERVSRGSRESLKILDEQSSYRQKQFIKYVCTYLLTYLGTLLSLQVPSGTFIISLKMFNEIVLNSKKRKKQYFLIHILYSCIVNSHVFFSSTKFKNKSINTNGIKLAAKINKKKENQNDQKNGRMFFFQTIKRAPRMRDSGTHSLLPGPSATILFLNPGNKPINPGAFFLSSTNPPYKKAQPDYIQIYLTPTH